MELPELDKIEPMMRYKQGNIPVLYEAIGVEISMTERWPSYFCCKPEVGDVVESTDGRRLAIKHIVHTSENNQAVLKIALGKDTGGQHEESGGGVESDW